MSNSSILLVKLKLGDETAVLNIWSSSSDLPLHTTLTPCLSSVLRAGLRKFKRKNFSKKQVMDEGGRWDVE